MKHQRGLSIVSALFLIMVLAAIGLFALRIGEAQQQGVTLAAIEHSANAAAHAGIEIGANRALRAGVCNANPALALAQGSLRGFTVTINCEPHTINGTEYPSFRITSTATRGTYGSTEFVSRRVVRTFSPAP